jgi:nicotinamidase-related amidase
VNQLVTPDAVESGAGALADWIKPGRTALVLIDMQVDFASPDGILAGYGIDMAPLAPALAASEALAEAARAASVPVIFVGLFTSPESDSPAWKTRMLRRGGDPEGDSHLCRIGEVGSDFYGPLPRPGDAIVKKTKYSGFVGTDLDARLKALGVDTLVVTGVTTECCVDCTVRDAFHLDYHVFIPTDACAAYEEDLHSSSLKNLELNCAILTTSAEVMSVWEPA